jgi:hypothetical protein
MKTLHLERMCTPPCGGVDRGVTPSVGSKGKKAPGRGSGVKPPKEKFPCKYIL